MDKKVIKNYNATIKIAMETFREMGEKEGFNSREDFRGFEWEIIGIKLAFYNMVVRENIDFNTAIYIDKHSEKIIARIKKIGSVYLK